MSVQVQKGSILIYRIFDVAEEIDLQKVDSLLSAAPDTETSRLKLTRSKRFSVVIRNAPIRVSLGKTELKLGDRNFTAETQATIWDYGAISITHSIAIPPGTGSDELLDLSATLIDEGKPSEDLDHISRKKCQELAATIHAALKGAAEWSVHEDYVIFFFEKVSGITDARDLLTQMDLPSIILGENEERLSDALRQDILSNVHQYSADDLLVLDWNSAVILDPTGQTDFPDVLEFALTHLFEMRYFDDLLDRRLGELYDAVEANPPRAWGRSFTRLSHEANTRYMELSEFLERVENSLKVVGNFYLATLFRAAAKRFRIGDWQTSITRKMNILTQVSEILQREVDVVRSHWLEAVIIFLILFEIVTAIA